MSNNKTFQTKKIITEYGGFITGKINKKPEIEKFIFTENLRSKNNYSFKPKTNELPENIIGEFHTHIHDILPSKKDDKTMFWKCLWKRKYLLGILCEYKPLRIWTMYVYQYSLFAKKKLIIKLMIKNHELRHKAFEKNRF